MILSQNKRWERKNIENRKENKTKNWMNFKKKKEWLVKDKKKRMDHNSYKQAMINEKLR